MSTAVDTIAIDRPRPGRGLREVGLVAGSAIAYSILCFVAPVVPSTAYRHAREILLVEHALGIDIELELNLWLHAHPVLASAASTFYSLSFFVVTFAALAIMWAKRPDRYGVARNALFLMTAGAALTYWTFPLAPPRLLSSLGYIDSVATQSAVGEGYTQATTALANPYGAMPSMHTGWAVWSALVLGMYVFRRWWQRLLLALHPILTILVIIATGNHYVLDALAGASYCAVALAFASALLAARSPKPSANWASSMADSERDTLNA